MHAMAGWGLILALVLSVIVAVVLFWFVKKLLPMVLHGILGIAVFWLLNYFGVLHVPIDIITFLIAAFGGVIGVAIVVALAVLGVPL